MIELTPAARQTYLPWVLAQVQKHIPFAYLQLAKEAGYDSDTAKECVAKLQAMIATPEETFYVYPHAPHTALARLYSAMGKTTEIKKVLKTPVKMGLELLSDDDDGNDWQGYLTLGDNLMFAGETENFIAAMSLITPNEVDGELPDEEDIKPIDLEALMNSVEAESSEKIAEVETVAMPNGDAPEVLPETTSTPEPDTETEASIQISLEEVANATDDKIEGTNTNDASSEIVQALTELNAIPQQPFTGPM